MFGEIAQKKQLKREIFSRRKWKEKFFWREIPTEMEHEKWKKAFVDKS